jgi:hypothetical protein
MPPLYIGLDALGRPRYQLECADVLAVSGRQKTLAEGGFSCENAINGRAAFSALNRTPGSRVETVVRDRGAASHRRFNCFRR